MQGKEIEGTKHSHAPSEQSVARLLSSVVKDANDFGAKRKGEIVTISSEQFSESESEGKIEFKENSKSSRDLQKDANVEQDHPGSACHKNSPQSNKWDCEWDCVMCESFLAKMHEFLTHIEEPRQSRHMTDSKIYVCHICKRIAPTHHALAKHILQHIVVASYNILYEGADSHYIARLLWRPSTHLNKSWNQQKRKRKANQLSTCNILNKFSNEKQLTCEESREMPAKASKRAKLYDGAKANSEFAATNSKLSNSLILPEFKILNIRSNTKVLGELPTTAIGSTVEIRTWDNGKGDCSKISDVRIQSDDSKNREATVVQTVIRNCLPAQIDSSFFLRKDTNIPVKSTFSAPSCTSAMLSPSIIVKSSNLCCSSQTSGTSSTVATETSSKHTVARLTNQNSFTIKRASVLLEDTSKKCSNSSSQHMRSLSSNSQTSSVVTTCTVKTSSACSKDTFISSDDKICDSKGQEGEPENQKSSLYHTNNTNLIPICTAASVVLKGYDSLAVGKVSDWDSAVTSRPHSSQFLNTPNSILSSKILTGVGTASINESLTCSTKVSHVAVTGISSSSNCTLTRPTFSNSQSLKGKTSHSSPQASTAISKEHPSMPLSRSAGIIDFQCCFQSFDSRMALDRHNYFHFTCKDCGRMFRDHLKFKKRCTELHQNQTPFKCACCPASLSTHQLLSNHVQYSHTNKMTHLFKCCRCSFSFSTVSKLFSISMLFSEVVNNTREIASSSQRFLKFSWCFIISTRFLKNTKISY